MSILFLKIGIVTCDINKIYLIYNPCLICCRYTGCIVLFDGEEIVQVEKKAKKDDEECEKFEKAKVCISKHEDKGDGIYACQLAIDDMNEDLEGTCISIV